MKKILLVEDSDEDFYLFDKAFKAVGDGHILTRFKTGDEFIDLLKDECKLISICDFLILDLNIPGYDGRYILRQIKRHESFKKIPVIILTTSNDVNDVDYCYSEGANSFVKKPSYYGEFKGVVGDMIRYWADVAKTPSISKGV